MNIHLRMIQYVATELDLGHVFPEFCVKMGMGLCWIMGP